MLLFNILALICTQFMGEGTQLVGLVARRSIKESKRS